MAYELQEVSHSTMKVFCRNYSFVKKFVVKSEISWDYFSISIDIKRNKQKILLREREPVKKEKYQNSPRWVLLSELGRKMDF